MVGQLDNERNFHIFYQFTKAASAEQRGRWSYSVHTIVYTHPTSTEAFGLQGPEAYAYTSRANCLEVPGIDDSQDFEDTLVSSLQPCPKGSVLASRHFQKAMNIIGLSAQEQTDIFRMLAVILWLGNVQFSEMDDGNASIDDTGVTDFIGYLTETDAALVAKVMTSKVVETQRGGRRGNTPAPGAASCTKMTSLSCQVRSTTSH